MYAIGYNNQSNATYSMSSSAFTWDSNRLATRGGENGGATKWNYTYDAKSQVASAKKTFVSGGANFKGTETLYYYDNIGNRDVVKEGPTLRETNYVTNERNQYTSVARPVAQLTAQVVGQRSNSTAKIKINSNDSAVLENVEYLPSSTGLYFYKEIANTPSSPASGDIFEPLYATQNGVDISPSQPDFAFVGAVSVTPQYDLDGNLTYDGRWTYTWDGENRLTKMTAPVWTQPSVGGYQSPEPGGNTIEALTMQFTYDGLSRRVTKTVTGGTTGTSREGYLYDGWNVIMVAQLDATSGPTSGAFQLRKWSCIWKPDVGSSLHARSSWQAAGGVGGLAWMQTGIAQAYYPPYQMGSAEIHIPMADHMGNIRHYFQIKSVAGSVTGQISGNLEYDAFGREVRAWGTTTGPNPPPGLPANRPFIDQLPFHFSSKFTDQESGFNYYGYRFYNADWGRWASRDPIGEVGGLNPYAMVKNDPVGRWDYLGLRTGPHAGRLIIRGCNKCPELIKEYRFVSEDGPGLRQLPRAGYNPAEGGDWIGLDVDALYQPGVATKLNDFGWISVICDCCRGTVTVRAQGIIFWYVGKDTPPTTSWPGGPQAVRPYPETAPPAPPTGPQGTDVDGPVGPGYRPPGSLGGYIPMGS